MSSSSQQSSSKKQKLSNDNVSDSDEEFTDSQASKVDTPSSLSASQDVKKNAEGDSYFELSRTRRVTVRKWKGKVLVDIREFYGEDDMKPGKKGISLSEEQWKSLVNLLPNIQMVVDQIK